MPGTATPELSQEANELGLAWTYANRINFMWYVEDVDWSGDYIAHVWDRPGGTELLVMTATATYEPLADPPRTSFSMTAADTTRVRGNGYWRLDDVDLDLTRFKGPVSVTP